MSGEWITGGTVGAWSHGQPVHGMPDVRTAPECHATVLANGSATVALVGDVHLTERDRNNLLQSAAESRWAALTHLPGSYWVIARNDRHRFVCGDLSGFRSIFHARHGPHTLWSTSARRLAQRCAARPDLAMVAARVAVGAEHWPDRTVYSDVRAVPGGRGLLLHKDAVDLVDVEDFHAVATLTQGAPRFGAALEEAVNWRTRTAGDCISADVSGGLDSSTLTILAARAGKVRAVTYTDPFTSGEDLRFARRVASHAGLDLQVSEGTPAELPFTWTSNQPVTDEPAAASMTYGQNALYLRPAAGLPLHLTGNGGDVVLDSCSAAWVGMVQRGERRPARRQVTNWARARNRAPRDLWRAVTRTAAIPYQQALTDAATAMERGDPPARRSGVWTWCHLGQSGAWLTPEGREQVAAQLREAAERPQLPTQADLFEQRVSLRLVGADARDTVPLTTPWGVRPVHPYLDNRVVRAAFAITPTERHGVTTFKPLLAAALPFLPTWLTNRQSKGSFRRHLTAGMLHHQPALAHLIRTSTLATSGLLDPEPALAALAAVGGTRADALYDLQRLVTSCQWLTTVEEAC